MKRLLVFLLLVGCAFSASAQDTQFWDPSRRVTTLPPAQLVFTGNQSSQIFEFIRYDSLYIAAKIAGLASNYETQAAELTGTSPTWNTTLGHKAYITLTGNTAVTLTGMANGVSLLLKATQDGAGSHTLTISGNPVDVDGNATATTWIGCHQINATISCFSTGTAIAPSDLDVTNSPTATQLLSKAAGDQFTWVNQAPGDSSQYTMIPLVSGTLAVTDEAYRMYAPETMRLTNAKLFVQTAPTGQAINVNFSENTREMLTAPLSIAAGTQVSTADPVWFDSTLAQFDSMNVQVEQIGSGVAGSDLSLWLEWRKWTTDTDPTGGDLSMLACYPLNTDGVWDNLVQDANYNLSEINNPGTAAGIISNAVSQSVGSSQGLDLSSTFAGTFDPGTGDWTARGWAKVNSLPAAGGFTSLWQHGATADPNPGWAVLLRDESHTITGVDTGAETFTVAQNVSHLVNGDVFTVEGSTGNNGQWTVSSTAGTGPTTITVTGDITNATVDGTIEAGEVRFYASDATNRLIMTHATNIITGNWYYIVTRYDTSDDATGAKIRIFTDGGTELGSEAVSTTHAGAADISSADDPFKVGADFSTYYDGLIDDVAIFSELKDNAWITSDVGGGTPTACSTYVP